MEHIRGISGQRNIARFTVSPRSNLRQLDAARGVQALIGRAR
jgi:hypothetical protein